MNIEIYSNIIKNVRLEQYVAAAALARQQAGDAAMRGASTNKILWMILDEQHAGRNN